ncbi:hypothetical protein SK128_003808 [Halocaridina rubra]|uniref:Discoidin domain-containing protein n=1 Tax=Halocaridina rubra TaxID=373956 RepID=A0AAN8WVK4_HALRR
MPDGDTRGSDHNLRDLTYDGSRRDGWLSGGLGQLIDGETGHTNFRVDALGRGRVSKKLRKDLVNHPINANVAPLSGHFKRQAVRATTNSYVN